MAAQIKPSRDTRQPGAFDDLDIAMDPRESVRVAGLRYVSDTMPGISRRRAGRGFHYRDATGSAISDKATLARIKGLVIPPAWQDVWICPTPHGHIQATGRDARGRKQYLYHPHWREVRDETKYARLAAFGAYLPGIRERATHDLAQPGLSEVKILATVVQLLNRTLIRVGNEEYARANKSYGLTTMRQRQVEVDGAEIAFEFKGKSGQRHAVAVHDARLARIVRRCEELPGYELFQYLDENGVRRGIESADVNRYLEEITGERFTAKDFRTWGGTVIAARTLSEIGPAETQTEAKAHIAEAIKSTARELGNTPAVCRRAYIHPTILDAYLSGIVIQPEDDDSDGPGLHPDERAVLEMLTDDQSQTAASAS